MSQENSTEKLSLPNGVMLNAYPDSIGKKLSDTVNMLKRDELKDVFSLFYILPTFFNSDLDRGFSIIDYDLNKELVSKDDLQELHKLKILFKFDLVLNHLSVGSPQFQDMLKNGDQSKFKDFFINWNEFWQGQGEMGPDGYIIPKKEHLDKLFMRKPGLPILKVRFPDGTEPPYWNTFYQEINYPSLSVDDVLTIVNSEKLSRSQAEELAQKVNNGVKKQIPLDEIDYGRNISVKEELIAYLEQNRKYLGQMDLNAKSETVWDFYDETFKKLRDHGGKLIRLDAFAYLHKEPGKTNFFNKPGTWDYLSKLKKIAKKYDLILLPEIHSEYGTGLHEEVAGEGYPIYDFFFPGLVIHALDFGTNKFLKRWIDEILKQDIKTINMLGCHDGIPVLDLKGKSMGGVYREGILSDTELDEVIDNILERGGRVKNLFGPDGKKISYYQVNATFYSALGEDDRKLLLARAIQLFMPGIPQVWYLDLFAGKNDYAAADKGGTGGHKEINRTTLTNKDIEDGLKKPLVSNQLELLRFRNTYPAFKGDLTVGKTKNDKIEMKWDHQSFSTELKADLSNYEFTITYTDSDGKENKITFPEL